MIGVSIRKGEVMKEGYVVVVDDMWEGGGSLVELGKEVEKEKGKEMRVLVRDGMLRKGVCVLEGMYDGVYGESVWWEKMRGEGVGLKSENRGGVK